MEDCKNTPRCDLVRTPNHKLCVTCATAVLQNRKLRMKRSRHARYTSSTREEQRGC